MLRAGMCSISVGIAVVAVALVVKSVGTYTPRPARDGWHADRLGVSVIQQWQLNNPAYRTAVSLRVPDDAGVRAAGSKKETVGVGSSDEAAVFEERYSFRAFRIVRRAVRRCGQIDPARRSQRREDGAYSASICDRCGNGVAHFRA